MCKILQTLWSDSWREYVYKLSIMETAKLNFQPWQYPPLCFFITEPVPLKFATHDTMETIRKQSTKRKLKLGSKRTLGHDNWVVAKEHLSCKRSLCITPHLVSDDRTARHLTARLLAGDSTLKNFSLHWVSPLFHCSAVKIGKLFCRSL